MKIFLIGYMGCGKSTLGKKVANRLGLQFVDADTLLEEKAGKTIPQIFEEVGEDKFRLLEQEVYQKWLKSMDNIVVGTGGGAPCFHNNMEEMNEQGLTVFLDLPAKVLVDRLKNAKEERPLVKNKSDEELFDFVSKHLEERREFYSKSNRRVTKVGLSATELDEFSLSLKKEATESN